MGSAEPTTETRMDAGARLAPLRRQRDLYRSLSLLAQRQRLLITSSRADELLGLMRERQKVVDALTELDPRVKALRDDWSNVYWQLSAAQRKEADALIADVQKLLAAVLAADDQDAKLLSARIVGHKKESLAVATSQRAARAYGVGVATTNAAVLRKGPQFLDSDG